MLAQEVKQRGAGIEHEGMTRPVDGEAHRKRLRRRQTRVCSVIGHPQLLSSVSYVPFFRTMAIRSSLACAIRSNRWRLLRAYSERPRRQGVTMNSRRRI